MCVAKVNCKRANTNSKICKKWLKTNKYCNGCPDIQPEELQQPAVIKSVCCKQCGKELKPIYMCLDCIKEEMDKRQTVL